MHVMAVADRFSFLFLKAMRLGRMSQPRLRRKPASKCVSRAPRPMMFCCCSECRVHQYLDMQAREVKVKAGCMITLDQFREHQKRENMKEATLRRLESTISPLPTLSPESAPDDGAQPLSPKGDSTSLPGNDIGRNQTLTSNTSSTPITSKITSHKTQVSSTFYSLLCSFRNRLRVRPIHTFFEEQSTLFKNPPTKASLKVPGYLDIDTGAPQNQAILIHERWLRDGLCRIEFQLKSTSYQTSSHERLLGRMVIRDIRTALDQLEKCKGREWDRQYTVVKEQSVLIIDTCKRISLIIFVTILTFKFSATYLSARTLIMEPLTCISFLFVSFLHLLANVSRQNCNTALLSIALLLRLSLQESTHPEAVSISDSIPRDIRTVVQSLGIEPKTHASVCCPKCFCTYSFNMDPDACDTDGEERIIAEHIPQFCSFKQSQDSPPCSERLRAPNASKDFLTRQFIYQDLHHWIGRMYARPDIEEYFDKYPDKNFDGREMHDIWDGSVLQNFIGPDSQPFMHRSGNEGRLVFGLNVDGFNAHGTSNSGKAFSIGGIYMVCFNLPPEIRYDMENVYLVGIIPGPDEPSTSEVNHVLRPLIDGLLVLWQDGIYLSRTPKHFHGRLVRAALIPLICDLPAARRVSGLGAHSFRLFCSECKLTRAKINELDSSKWERRTQEEHREHAENWRNAQTPSDQARVFKEYGIRWSELLRLPYWDPTKYIVIDSMHGFYLRMFHRHIRDIWGMSVEFKDGNGLVGPNLDNLQEKDAIEGEQILRFGSTDQLKGLPELVLKYLCHLLDLPFNGPKESLLKSLEIYVRLCKLCAWQNTYLMLQRVERGWFHHDGTWIQCAPFAEPEITNPSEGLAFGPPTEEEVFLKAYEARSNVAIKALKKATLVALCVNKLKGTVQDYERYTKPVLTDLILRLVSLHLIFLDPRLMLHSEIKREADRIRRIHRTMKTARTVNCKREGRYLEKKLSKLSRRTWSD